VRAALLLIVFVACRSGPPPRTNGCIVSAQEASDIYGTAGRFTPSDRDIRALQATLGDFLAGEEGTERIIQRLARYSGVFVGIMVNGHRLVLASYSCGHQHTPCSERIGTIDLDGGDCYFNVEFDLETREYKNLTINGIASSENRRRRDG
jgi:hypothetical protein